MIKYALAAALLASLGLCGALYIVQARNDALTADNVGLRRSVATLEKQAAQSALAREIEAARAERWRARSVELSATIDQIQEIPDAPLDPRIIDILDSLRTSD